MTRNAKGTLGSETSARIVSLPARTYTESEWSGRPNYTCVTCGFVTTDQALMIAHVAAHQPVAPPAPEPAPRPFGVLPHVASPVMPEPVSSVASEEPGTPGDARRRIVGDPEPADKDNV